LPFNLLNGNSKNDEEEKMGEKPQAKQIWLMEEAKLGCCCTFAFFQISNSTK
jgi:hypothetical protein